MATICHEWGLRPSTGYINFGIERRKRRRRTKKKKKGDQRSIWFCFSENVQLLQLEHVLFRSIVFLFVCRQPLWNFLQYVVYLRFNFPSKLSTASDITDDSILVCEKSFQLNHWSYCRKWQLKNYTTFAIKSIWSINGPINVGKIVYPVAAFLLYHELIVIWFLRGDDDDDNWPNRWMHVGWNCSVEFQFISLFFHCIRCT